MSNPSISIYNASAGSGKTYTLVKEYLKIILVAQKNDAYRNILAITFTNKAVGEMKKRIVDSLHAFAKDDQSSKTLDLLADLEIETKMSSVKIREKSKKILKNIIHNYASFDISTIDKFTHRILRSFSFDLELPALFEVSLDTDELLTEAVDAIVAKAGEDKMLTQVLVDFALDKTDKDKSWDISREIFEMSKLLVNENDKKQLVNYKEKSIAEFLTLKKQLYTNCLELEAKSVKIAQDALDLIDSNGIERSSFYRGYIPNYFIKITKGNLFKYDKLHYLDDGNRYAKTKPQGQKDGIDGISNQLLELGLQINDLAEKYYLYQAFLKNIIPLSLLKTISVALETIQKEKNIVSIAEFNSIINKEIQTQPAPFIYERLGERYRHFFIDEFQDTSEMQWQNLIPLIDNALAGQDDFGTKGTLLLVGDPKQSIYRWRGGKAEQFIDLTKDVNPFVVPEKEIKSLDTNYRSYSQVIDFNNNFFRFVSSFFTNEDYINLYANNSFQNINSKIGGYVSLRFVEKKIGKERDYNQENDDTDDDVSKQQLYLQATLQTINEAVAKGFNHGDIVILTRKNSDGVAVANFLTENEIPIISSETLLMYWSTEIRALLHLFEYIESYKNTLSKAGFLQYLGEYRQDKLDVHAFITQGLQHQNNLDFEKWLANFGIKISFENLKQKSIYEMCEICIHTFFAADKKHAYVQYFLDIVLEFDVRKQSSLSDFIEFWHKKEDKFSIPSPENGAAVRIMSIHKSKGLEFPVVIVPFLDSKIKPTKSQLWLENKDDFSGISNILIPRSASLISNLSQHAENQFSKKAQEELLDIINVLYVAFTRAEEQLYLISSLTLTAKNELSTVNISYFMALFLKDKNLFDDESLFYEWGNSAKCSEHKISDAKATIPIQNVAHLFNPKNIKIAKREALLWDTKQGKAIEYGTILHEIIASISSENDIANALEKAIEEGKITSEDKPEIYAKIVEIVTYPDLKKYFDTQNTILNEQAILVKNGKTIKPDKMVLLDNQQALLLDYKTGKPETKHKKQIEEYGLVLHEMGYSVIEKKLVYIGETIDIIEV